MSEASTPPTPPAGPRIVESKNPGIAAVLALLLGIVGLWGIGHIYVGKIKRGIVLLVLGIVLVIVAVVGFLGVLFAGALLGGVGGLFAGLGVGLLFFVIVIAGWIWQTYDAYKLAKRFNAYVEQNGKAPW